MAEVKNSDGRRPPRRGRAKARKSRLGLWTVLVLGLLLVVYAGVLELSRPHVGGERLRYDSFVRLVGSGRVESVRILDEDAYAVGTYRPADGVSAEYNAPLIRGTQGALLETLIRSRVPIEVDQQVGKRVAALASFLLPGLIIVVLFGYMILSYRRGSGVFGVRSGARRFDAEAASVTFADVAGQDAAVAELREVSTYLSDPERYRALGAEVPKGVLLYGPPGCGKTLLARALAGEAGAAFFSISGSDFVEMYVGVGASRVRDLFREARENAPAIVFIDELDSIGRSRGVAGAVAAQGEQEHALNQVLAEMDGFSALDGVILVAATNRPDILDPALLRPGRLDRTIGLERPDEAARLAILELHASRRPMDAGTDLAGVAHRAIGLTGADLASVVNEAALLAARDGDALVAQSHLDRALQRILEAPERQRRLSLREKGIARRFTEHDRVTFDDVAGADDAVAELAEVREFLAEPERFEALGARMPRGILLAGPPGCGKTLLARAVAGDANAAFFSVAASEFVEVFVGEGASRVRELFAEARAMAPAIVFIDELDSIGARRGAGADGHREREQTLNQILVELDGFESRAAVVVMAATNRPDILDPALVRPGRFDRTVSVGLPDRAGRRAILELHATGKPLAPGVDLDLVARLTQGFSGADLANVVNEAALLAARRGVAQITFPLLEEGVDRALLGVSGHATRMSSIERRAVAYHEAGHALVAMALPNTAPPHKLTIVPRGRTLGHCARVAEDDKVLFSRSALLDDLAVALGGRAAEDLVLGDPLSGVADDLRRVGDIARRMVCELGMSDAVGLVPHADGGLSNDAARVIETEVRRLVDDAYGRARRVLLAWRAALDAVASALLEHETLSAADLERLAGPAPVLAPVAEAGHMRVVPPSAP